MLELDYEIFFFKEIFTYYLWIKLIIEDTEVMFIYFKLNLQYFIFQQTFRCEIHKCR